MAQQITVTIKSPDNKKDREGIVKQTFKEVEQLRGILVPVVSQKQQEDFGFREKVEYAFVYKNPKKNGNLKIGNTIENLHIKEAIYYPNKATIVGLEGVM